MHNQLALAAAFSRANNSAVAAATNITSGQWLDMEGYDSCLWILAMGALSANQVTKLQAQGSNDSGGSGAVDLSGAITAAPADADSNNLLILEITKPPDYRYVHVDIKRATGNAVIDACIAIRFSSKKQPTTQPATVSSCVVACEPKASDTNFTVTTTTPGSTTTKIVTTARTAS